MTNTESCRKYRQTDKGRAAAAKAAKTYRAAKKLRDSLNLEKAPQNELQQPDAAHAPE